MNTTIRFGTDGVRGLAGQWPIDGAGAEHIGRGIGTWTDGGRVLVGRDTRASGPTLQESLTNGLTACGADVVDLGVLPTAAVSAAVADDPEARAGVMITASHNPAHDNGIKVVDANGEKLTDLPPLLAAMDSPSPRSGGQSRVHRSPLAPWLARLPDVDLSGRRILLDAAHGAGSEAGRIALEACGADVVCIGASPDGQNINDGVGAMAPPTDLRGCDFAICLDGDADRLVMVDPEHGVLDGDDLLWMLCQRTEHPVVGTVMTNGGLAEALGDRFRRTGVGDAKVHAEMVRVGAPVGGEPSGHIMIKGGMPTSCGIDTALRVLAICGAGPLPVGGWSRRKQTMRNVRGKAVDLDLPELERARQLGLRVVLRASGTEPLVRVMVEGNGSEDMADAIVNALPDLPTPG